MWAAFPYLAWASKVFLAALLFDIIGFYSMTTMTTHLMATMFCFSSLQTCAQYYKQVCTSGFGKILLCSTHLLFF